jgi:hypothetical protein
MKKETISKINNLLELLTEQEKDEVVLEINEIENKTVYVFLEKNGFLSDRYDVEYSKEKPLIEQNYAIVHFWYKENHTTWTIVMYQIRELLKMNGLSNI